MKQLMILAAMMVITISAKAISYEDAKDDALFLTDKMAYELSLTDEQYEAVYEINLDYLLCLNKSADLFGVYWERRNSDLRFVLSDWQYEKYLSIEYFYRPVKWEDAAWVFLVYSHYARDLFYFTHPKVYNTYLGGNCFKSDRFYADRIAHKPDSPDHHHAPAAHGTAPAPAPNNAAKPATPNNNPASPAPNNAAKPATPNNAAKPATPNNNPKPATTPSNNPRPTTTPSRPAGNPGGGAPGGGRPAGGGPGGRR